MNIRIALVRRSLRWHNRRKFDEVLMNGSHNCHGHEHGDRKHAEGHGHHHHDHGHLPSPGSHGLTFPIAVALNVAFVVIEVIAGWRYGSMALLADAGHNFSDVLSLLLAWGASILAAKPPSTRFTYGLKSSSILAALANVALLFAALGAILIETVQRLADPEPVAGGMIMAVAAAGILVNAMSALLFAGGHKHDLNLRAAFVHLLADAAVSAGVVVAGAIVVRTGWTWIDPATSLVITMVIAIGSWGLLRDSLKAGLLAVPDRVDHGAVQDYLAALDGVSAVHDLHIWPMSTTETALTAHLVMPDGHPGDAFLHGIAHVLAHDFDIGHATIQVEQSMADCALAPEEVV